MRSDKNFLFSARARALECTDTVYSLSGGPPVFKGIRVARIYARRGISMAPRPQGRNWDGGCGYLYFFLLLYF